MNEIKDAILLAMTTVAITRANGWMNSNSVAETVLEVIAWAIIFFSVCGIVDYEIRRYKRIRKTKKARRMAVRTGR